MRIIAGEFGGRRLQAPPGIGTRPMLDRVREALFSTLAGHFDRGRVLDLFAGTGALGLEALSRGSIVARMIELDPKVTKVLQQNVADLGVAARARVLTGDALSPATWKDPLAPKYDVVFCDPPYPMLQIGPGRERVLETLGRLGAQWLAEDGVIVFHAPRGLMRESEFSGLISRERSYGTSSIWYLGAQSPAETP